LNFQIEHHLFPRICHVHYPALAPIVEEVCRNNGVAYFVHPTMRAALASHVRWLRRMGQRPEAASGGQSEQSDQSDNNGQERAEARVLAG
jgi:fatty acid desaturase